MVGIEYPGRVFGWDAHGSRGAHVGSSSSAYLFHILFAPGILKVRGVAIEEGDVCLPSFLFWSFWDFYRSKAKSRDVQAWVWCDLPLKGVHDV